MALDVGEKRIGVAVSDPLGTTAQPLETIKRDIHALDRLEGLVTELEIERLVVGLPLLLDGREGKQVSLVRQFVDEIEGRLSIPVTLFDERFSTREADAVIREEKLSRIDKRDAADRIAAALILRGYLDSLQGG